MTNGVRVKAISELLDEMIERLDAIREDEQRKTRSGRYHAFEKLDHAANEIMLASIIMDDLVDPSNELTNWKLDMNKWSELDGALERALDDIAAFWNDLDSLHEVLSAALMPALDYVGALEKPSAVAVDY